VNSNGWAVTSHPPPPLPSKHKNMAEMNVNPSSELRKSYRPYRARAGAALMTALMLAGCQTAGNSSEQAFVPETLQSTARRLDHFLNGQAKQYEGHSLVDVTFSTDLSTVAAFYTDGFFAVWETADTKRPVMTRPPPSPDYQYNHVAFSPNGEVVAERPSSSSDDVAVWTLANPRDEIFLHTEESERIQEYMFTGDDLLLLSVSPLAPVMQSALYLVDFNGTTHASYQFPTDSVRPFGDTSGAMSFNAQTQEHLAEASWQDANYESHNGLLAWNPENTPRLIPLECNSEGVFSEDGTLFACHSGPESDILMWNVSENREVARWEVGGAKATRAGQLTFFDESRGLAVERGTHDSSNRLDTTIELYEIASHALVSKHHLKPIANRPNLSSSQLGGMDILVYKLDFAQESGLVDPVYFVFPTPTFRHR
jgi:hypothetical protein